MNIPLFFPKLQAELLASATLAAWEAWEAWEVDMVDHYLMMVNEDG